MFGQTKLLSLIPDVTSMMLSPMNAWLAWVGWLRGEGVGQAEWGVWSSHSPQFIYYLEGGRLGEIYSPNLPLPLHIYNIRFQGYASELFFNQNI